MRRIVLVVSLCLTGCIGEMDDGSRYRPLESTEVFADRSSSRPIPEGTVPVNAPPSRRVTITADRETLARGAERWAIYCTPCHGVRGEGDGTVPRAGFPPPPSLVQGGHAGAHGPEEIVEVIRGGKGAMPAYGDRIPEEDRWAIAAWLLNLQGVDASSWSFSAGGVDGAGEADAAGDGHGGHEH